MVHFLIIFLLTALATAQTPFPPIWPQVFSSSIHESYPSTPSHITGKLFYDSKSDLMRIDRSDGQFDMFCSSLQPNVSTPCTFIMREKKRWIIFPERRICCYCCDDRHGCGRPDREFLAKTKYQGYEALDDESYFRWRFDTGDAANYYYDTPDLDRIPRRFTNSNRTITDFIVKTFSTSPIPSQVFALPDYCKSTCPMTTICGKLQMSSLKTQ